MAEPWIRVHANLANKPIAHRASAALGVRRATAIGHLVLFWGNVSQHAANGAVAHYDDALLESWAMWEGKRGVFAKFLREHHFDAEGRVREWDDYAGALEHRRAVNRQHQQTYRERQRQQREGLRGDDVSLTKPLRNNPTIRDDTKRDEVLTTTASASRKKPRETAAPADPWLAPYLDLWTARVGIVTPRRCATAIAPVRAQYGDEATLRGLTAYLDEPRGPDKPVRLEYFKADAARWIREGATPLVQDGVITARGERVSRSA